MEKFKKDYFEDHEREIQWLNGQIQDLTNEISRIRKEKDDFALATELGIKPAFQIGDKIGMFIIIKMVLTDVRPYVKENMSLIDKYVYDKKWKYTLFKNNNNNRKGEMKMLLENELVEYQKSLEK